MNIQHYSMFSMRPFGISPRWQVMMRRCKRRSLNYWEIQTRMFGIRLFGISSRWGVMMKRCERGSSNYWEIQHFRLYLINQYKI